MRGHSMNNTILWIIVVIAMLLVGILIIPRLTRKATGKLYKKNLHILRWISIISALSS